MPITDILRLADEVAISILRLEVGFEAAASTARLTLLMSRNNIPVAILLRQALGYKFLLASAPGVIFSLDNGGRDL